MPVRGDMDALRALGAKLRGAAEGMMREVSRSLRDEAHRQTLACFTEKRDPYGRPWSARKAPAGGWPLLDKSGDLINSVTARALTRGVEIRMNSYGIFHWQPEGRGKGIMPQRAMLPTHRQGLGDIWAEAFVRASGGAVRAYMGAA